MKLIRFGATGTERPGIMAKDGRRRAIPDFVDWDRAFFGDGGLDKLAVLVQERGEASFPEVPLAERWAAPIARPGKIICIGLNYSDHARGSAEVLQQ